MNNLNRFIFSLLCILTASSLFAIPARRDVITYVQPDGLQISITLVGDEFGSYCMTTDGLMVEKDSDGSWKYVTSIEGGRRKLSKISAHDISYRNDEENNLIQSINQRALIKEANGIRSKKISERSFTYVPKNIPTRSLQKNIGPYSTNGFPTAGNIKGLVILAQFPDKKFSMDDSIIRAQYDEMLNKNGYSDTFHLDGRQQIGAIGSVKDYFEAQSFGKFSPTFDVIGPIMAKNNYKYYGANVGGVRGEDARNARKLIIEACNKAKSLVNFSDYDANSDGIVDFVYVIYAGQGENFQGSDEYTIWPHQWEISLQVGTKVVRSYACSAELFYKSVNILDGIGTICHEFSHIIGLPDFYSVSGNENIFAMNSWSIMDYGNYDNYGFAPTGYTAFERYSVIFRPSARLSPRCFFRAGMLKNNCSTVISVPVSAPAGLKTGGVPPSISARVPVSSASVFVVITTLETAAIEASASPRNPSVSMQNRSFALFSLLVACGANAS